MALRVYHRTLVTFVTRSTSFAAIMSMHMLFVSARTFVAPRRRASIVRHAESWDDPKDSPRERDVALLDGVGGRHPTMVGPQGPDTDASPDRRVAPLLAVPWDRAQIHSCRDHVVGLGGSEPPGSAETATITEIGAQPPFPNSPAAGSPARGDPGMPVTRAGDEALPALSDGVS
jgi:hypothetical protein